jgi:hypothetical protein
MTLWLPFQNTYLHNPRTVVEQTILRYAHFLQRFVKTKRTHQDINLNMVVRRPGKVCGDCADLSVVLVLLTPNAFNYNIMYWIWGLRTNPGILFHIITHGPNHKTNKSKIYLSQQLSNKKPIWTQRVSQKGVIVMWVAGACLKKVGRAITRANAH